MDYKELIDTLRTHKPFRYGTFGLCENAANAIETLLAERDAAVEDLHRMHTLCMVIGGCCPECGSQIDNLMDTACGFCKGPEVSCWVDDPEDERRCAAFEWRGPQKGEAHGSQ